MRRRDVAVVDAASGETGRRLMTMADISLYLTNVNVSVGQNMAVEQRLSPGRDFECVELGELDKRGEQQQQREKAPRRIIHFSSGETMEEYSTDEEEGEDPEPERKDLLASPVDASKMTWGPYFWFHMWRAATSTISACDYLGERMASLFGITSAKYQYAIDEYYRMKKETEEEKEENRLSEEAEQSFNQRHAQEDQDEVTDRTDANVTYQMENESQVPSSTIGVPVIITAT